MSLITIDTSSPPTNSDPGKARVNVDTLRNMLMEMAIRLKALETKAELAGMNVDASGDQDVLDYFTVCTQLPYVILEQSRKNPQAMALSPYQVKLLYSLIATDRSELSTSFTVKEFANFAFIFAHQPHLENTNLQELIPVPSSADTNDGRFTVDTGIKLDRDPMTGKYFAGPSTAKSVVAIKADKLVTAIQELKVSADVAASGDEDKSMGSSSASSSSIVDNGSIVENVTRHIRGLSISSVSGDSEMTPASSSTITATNTEERKARIKKVLAELGLGLGIGPRPPGGANKSNSSSSYNKIPVSVTTGTALGRQEPPLSIPFSLLWTDNFFQEHVVATAYLVMKHLPLLECLGCVVGSVGEIDATPEGLRKWSDTMAQPVIDTLDLRITSDLDAVRPYLLNSVLGPVQLHWAHVLRLIQIIAKPQSSRLPIKITSSDILAINSIRTAAAPLLHPQTDVYDVALLRKHSDSTINQMFMMLTRSVQAALTLAVSTGRRLFVQMLPSKKGRTWVDVLKTAIQLLRLLGKEEYTPDTVGSIIASSREFFLDVLINHRDHPFADLAITFSECKVESSDKHTTAGVMCTWWCLGRILTLIVAEMVQIHGAKIKVEPGDEQARQATVIVSKFARDVTSFFLHEFPFEPFDILLKDLVAEL